MGLPTERGAYFLPFCSPTHARTCYLSLALKSLKIKVKRGNEGPNILGIDREWWSLPSDQERTQCLRERRPEQTQGYLENHRLGGLNKVNSALRVLETRKSSMKVLLIPRLVRPAFWACTESSLRPQAALPRDMYTHACAGARTHVHAHTHRARF